jgi:hypothetical protein
MFELADVLTSLTIGTGLALLYLAYVLTRDMLAGRPWRPTPQGRAAWFVTETATGNPLGVIVTEGTRPPITAPSTTVERLPVLPQWAQHDGPQIIPIAWPRPALVEESERARATYEGSFYPYG